MHKLQRLSIHWNDDIDSYMTKVESSDKVLAEFFRINDWGFIRHIFLAVVDETGVEYKNKSIAFEKDKVNLYVDGGKTQMDRFEYLQVFFYLFDLVIIGANDDHHGIRYEPWWQEFTEASYQLRCKIEIHNQLYKGAV